jgi:hypothetical protein
MEEKITGNMKEVSAPVFGYKQGICMAIAKDLIAGSASGIAQVLVGQPFDIVKVRMQRQSVLNPIYKVCLKVIQLLFYF